MMSEHDSFSFMDDALKPDAEQLEKQGWLGKRIAKSKLFQTIVRISGDFISRHRSCATIAVFVLLAIGVGCTVLISSKFLLSIALALSQMLGWSDFSSAVRYYSGEFPHDTVRLPSGIMVERVIEPAGSISDNFSVFLLLWHMAQTERKELSQAQIKLGYAEWHVTDKQMHNFTFSAAKKIAAREVKDEPCLCLLQMGIPYNIVFLKETAELMFEPTMEHEGPPTVELDEEHRGPAFQLLKNAESHSPTTTKKKENSLAFSSAAAGIVRFTTEAGLFKRSKLYESFVCVKQCTVLFKECADGVFSH